MKKRSLFAAVAMLVVSAIVMTSATYAWFASSSTATVTGFSATVTNSDGSLMVSGNSGFTEWGYTLAASNIDASNKAVATNLVPVSVTPDYVDPSTSAHSYKVVGGSFGQGSKVWTGSAASAGASGQYSTYTFKLKSTVNASISGWASSVVAGKDYLRAAIYVDGVLAKVYGVANANSYNPIKWTAAYETTPSSLTGTDADDDWVMDWTDSTTNEGVETAAAFADTVTSGTKTTNNFTINATADQEYTIMVLIWAEGQDPACVGSASGQAISFDLNFEK